MVTNAEAPSSAIVSCNNNATGNSFVVSSNAANTTFTFLAIGCPAIGLDAAALTELFNRAATL